MSLSVSLLLQLWKSACCLELENAWIRKWVNNYADGEKWLAGPLVIFSSYHPTSDTFDPDEETKGRSRILAKIQGIQGSNRGNLKRNRSLEIRGEHNKLRDVIWRGSAWQSLWQKLIPIQNLNKEWRKVNQKQRFPESLQKHCLSVNMEWQITNSKNSIYFLPVCIEFLLNSDAEFPAKAEYLVCSGGEEDDPNTAWWR